MSLDYRNIEITEEIFNSPEYNRYRQERLNTLHNCGVYMIQNKLNNHIYIGSSTNTKRRFSAHRNDLQKNKHSNGHLQNAWNKYGSESFQFFIVETNSYPETVIQRENKHIQLYKPEYNIIQVNNSLQFFHSKETKDKIREKAKGRVPSDESNLKRSITLSGRIISDEHRRKISIGNKGKKRTAEQIEKIRISSSEPSRIKKLIEFNHSRKRI